jgi:hypothetical protein
VNNNAAKEFQLTKDLPLEFLLAMSAANALKLKKVAVFKEFILPIVDHVNVSESTDLLQL